MATVKTIKPAGGGDYTTLSTWWTFAAAQATAAQWAECYSGGDLGSIIWSGGPDPDANNYYKIYAAPGHSHNGSVSSGAYTTGLIFGSPDYSRFQGIRINNDQFWALYPGSISFFDSVLIHGGGGVFASNGHDNVFQNFLIILGGSTNYGFELDSGSTNIDIYNCTIYGGGSAGIRVRFNCVLRNVKNTICANNVGGDIQNDGTITTSLNNATTDGTADDAGGTGHLVNQTATNLFVNPGGNDFTLKTGSALRAAGVDLSSIFTTDIVGNTRSTSSAAALKTLSTGIMVYPKPGIAGGAWDIGAFQNSSGTPTIQPDEAEGGTRVFSGGRWSSQTQNTTDRIGIDRSGINRKLADRFNDYSYYGEKNNG